MAIDVFIRAVADESEPLSDAPFHEASDPSVSEIVEFHRFLSTLYEEERRVLLTAMVEQAEENLELDFTSIFRHCLRNEDDHLVQLGVEGLWEQEERWLITELVDLLRSERGARVRAASAVALGKFPALAQEGKISAQDGALVYRVLMDFLEDEIEDLEVRRRCLEAIAPFNTEEVRDYIRWAYDDEDQDLRSSSIYAMGRTGAMSWLPTLHAGAGELRRRRTVRDSPRLRGVGRSAGRAATYRAAPGRGPRGTAGKHCGTGQDWRHRGSTSPDRLRPGRGRGNVGGRPRRTREPAVPRRSNASYARRHLDRESSLPPLTESQARFLADARVARLATADPEGRPQVIPVCFAFDGEAIYIVLDQKPKSVELTRLRRVRNILANPQAALVVDHYDEDWQSLRYVLVSCMAEMLSGEEGEAATAVAHLREKYLQYRTMDLDGNPVIKLTPRRFTAWSFSGE